MSIYPTSCYKPGLFFLAALGTGCHGNRIQSSTHAGDVSKHAYVSACSRDKFCESILEVHYSNCTKAAMRVSKGLSKKEHYALFSSCVNDSSGYQLLKVSHNGRLIANQIEH